MKRSSWSLGGDLGLPFGVRRRGLGGGRGLGLSGSIPQHEQRQEQPLGQTLAKPVVAAAHFRDQRVDLGFQPAEGLFQAHAVVRQWRLRPGISLAPQPPAGQVPGCRRPILRIVENLLMEGTGSADRIRGGNPMRRRISERRPQFVRMNAAREEAPPPRHITCADYRTCLSAAAFQNLCLDCSQCADEAPAAPSVAARPRPMRAPAPVQAAHS